MSVIEEALPWPGFADGFRIYRSTSEGGPYGDPIAEPAADKRMFEDSTVIQGVTYYYVITFIHVFPHPITFADITYESPYSNEIEISTCTPPPQPTDVVFIIDNTLSATGEEAERMPAIKNGVLAALDEIVAASTTYRLALVTPDNDQVHVRLNFEAGNRNDLEDEVENLPDLGHPTGWFIPESTDECIKTAVEARAASQVLPPSCTRPQEDPPPPLQIDDFTPAFGYSRKLIVLITDAAPGGLCDPERFFQSPHGDYARAIAQEARTNCIRINAIQVPNKSGGLDADPASVMQDYRDLTCGWFIQVPMAHLDATGVKEAILRMLYARGACECQ